MAGTGRLLRITALLAAALALTVPSAEAAKGKGGAKLKTATATASAAGLFSVASATARCPAKTVAVAGGYSTSVPALPPAATSHWLNVYESQRIGQAKWRVSAAEHFPSAAADTLSAYVYCEALKAKVKTGSATIALPAIANTGTTAFATCPNGTKPLSGGFVTPVPTAAGESYVSRSIAGNGVGWVVDVTRLAGADARNLVAIAYCAKVGAVKTRSASATVLGPANSTGVALTGSCPKGSSARGGGFATSTPVGGLLSTALVYETRRAGKAWSSAASASGAATSSTLVTNAYCR
jgi:hypothetical protein